MASSTTIDVDYDIDKEDGGMDTLDFQDIPHSSDGAEKGKTHEFTNFPHSAMDSDEDAEEDSAKLLKDEKTAPASSSSFWTFSYYQQFFDVETKQVGQRIIGSMLPKPGSNYLLKEIRPNPDLYGPFWICTTLVFTTAIAGNLANYFGSAGTDYHWKYDFHKVTFAATAIFSYWWVIPLILFGLMWWQGYRERFSFLEMICVYGYSLAIYIPISVLWAIQVAWLQWTLVVLGAVLSGSVLLLNFWPVVSEGNKKIAIGVMVFMFVMHMALAAGFVLYFFNVPAVPAKAPSTVTNSTASPLNAKLSHPLAGKLNTPSRNAFQKSESPLKKNDIQSPVQHVAGNNLAQQSPNGESPLKKNDIHAPVQPMPGGVVPKSLGEQGLNVRSSRNPQGQKQDAVKAKVADPFKPLAANPSNP